MAPRKSRLGLATLGNTTRSESTEQNHLKKSRRLRKGPRSGRSLYNTVPLFDATPRPSPAMRSSIFSPDSANEIIKRESGSNNGQDNVPSMIPDNPDPFWLREWETLDLGSAMASQVKFLKTNPKVNNSNPSYVYFFNKIQNTLLRAKDPANHVLDAPVTKDLFLSLRKYFAEFAKRTKSLLRDDLEGIKDAAHGHFQTTADLENFLFDQDDFLSQTRPMASLTGLGDDWMTALASLGVAKKTLGLAEPRGAIDGDKLSEQDNHLVSLTGFAGPLSAELLKMDYTFDDSIWSRWIEGCIAYFSCWTADSTRKSPPGDFIRHISHYHLAIELSIRRPSTLNERIAMLVKLAKTYMRQFRGCAAAMLEKRYSELKQSVLKADLFQTEAAFSRLAEDLEILMNEPPKDIRVEAWDDVSPAMLPHDKVVGAQNALTLLYKEFQAKRYPEDEVAYLWLLVWRNIKHTLPYFLSVLRSDTESNGPPVSISPRDLAIPFVRKNALQLGSIVQRDNDAMFPREIERLVGDYCTLIDEYARGEGKDQDLIYEQFSQLSTSERVPSVCLTTLERSLLISQVEPTNTSQAIVHRVARRLNYIMGGPKEFKRWYYTQDGFVQTYSPSVRWIQEQDESRRSAGCTPDGPNGPPSRSSPLPLASTSGTISAVAAGGDEGSDSDDNDKKCLPPGDDKHSSNSEGEIEEVSPGGTRRMVRQKKARDVEEPVTAGVLTKEKLDRLAQLSEIPDSDLTGSVSRSRPEDKSNSSEGEGSEELEVIVSGFHLSPTDSLDYHRRRLGLLRVEEPSAVPNAQYPLPETAAPQRAAALQISRELADPGFSTEGPRPQDVQNHINPTLLLPSIEGDDVASNAGMFSTHHHHHH